MGFHEIRFPEDIAFGSSGGPGYSTDVVELASGHEQRNSNWGAARARYNVAHGVKTKAQLDALIAFFRARKGRAYGFRFKDWTDYQASAVNLGSGDGARTSFAIVKRYDSGGAYEQRRISKPVSGTVTVYLAGVEQVSGFTVNHMTGVVGFTSPPGLGVAVAVDFEFDVPVRFDTDRLSASLESYGSYSWTEIPLVEVRA